MASAPVQNTGSNHINGSNHRADATDMSFVFQPTITQIPERSFNPYLAIPFGGESNTTPPMIAVNSTAVRISECNFLKSLDPTLFESVRFDQRSCFIVLNSLAFISTLLDSNQNVDGVKNDHLVQNHSHHHQKRRIIERNENQPINVSVALSTETKRHVMPKPPVSNGKCWCLTQSSFYFWNDSIYFQWHINSKILNCERCNSPYSSFEYTFQIHVRQTG